MPTGVSVSLDDIVDGMQQVSSDISVFLDASSGEVLVVPEDILALVDEDDLDDRADWEIEEATRLRELFDSDHCVEFPRREEIDEWSMMERFASAIEDEQARERLLDALRGKGAFRRFKDVADRLELLQDWYAHRDAAYAMFARKWLQDSDIPFSDKT
jgi:hypothetical protein